MKTYKYKISGVSCASCAMKLEKKLNEQTYIENCTINFSAGKIKFQTNDLDQVKKDVRTFERGARLYLDEKEQEKRRKREERMFFIKILLTIILTVIALIVSKTDYSMYSFYIGIFAYLIIANNVLIKALRNILAGDFMDEFFLMSVATLAAISIDKLPEAIAVMLFYEIGEHMQDKAVDNSKDSIESLLKLTVNEANLKMDNKIKRVHVNKIKVDDIIVINNGEKVPLDGVIIDGMGILDTSSMTGESVPRNYSVNDEILAGMINLGDSIQVKVSRVFADSSISKMLDLIESSGENKTKQEEFITRFAKIYTPIIVAIAVAVVVILPFLGVDFNEAVYRAVMLLVISCPCALVISVPLSYFAGIGAAAKHGVLIKGSTYLDGLAKMKTIMFDKTGTLTNGKFSISELKTYNGYSKDVALLYAAYGEMNSTHPIAKSVVEANTLELNAHALSNVRERQGHGVAYMVNDDECLVGSKQMLIDAGVKVNVETITGTLVYLAVAGVHVATIALADTVKPDTVNAINEFKALGITKTVVLSGDLESVVKQVASDCNITQAHWALKPEDKVNYLETELQAGEGFVGFVGDGINDAAVIARSDVGIAMGALGSDVAIETADVVVNNDSLYSLAHGVKIAKETKKIANQNIVFALVVKIVFLVLAVFGVTTMWEAVFSDVGVTIIAVANAGRLMKIKYN